MTFDEFTEMNRARCEAAFHPVKSWSPALWGLAASGEMGETCNLLKKQVRGDKVLVEDIANEIGDVVAYLDLLAQSLDLRLEDCVRDKFNIVSKRVGHPEFTFTGEPA